MDILRKSSTHFTQHFFCALLDANTLSRRRRDDDSSARRDGHHHGDAANDYL